MPRVDRVAALVVIALLVWGSPIAGPAAAQTPAGDVAVSFHVTLAPSWFDPSTAPPQITPFGVMYAIHDALVRPLPGQKMGPSLAEAWTESADGLVYEFRLRRGLKFHNGDPLTTAQAQWSFKRYQGAGAPGGGGRCPAHPLPPEGRVAGLHDLLRHHRHRGRHRAAPQVRGAGRARRLPAEAGRRGALPARAPTPG